MNGAFEYRNLLSQAMSDYNEKVSDAREKFEAKNAIVEGIKASIERATDIPAAAFLTKPLETTVNVIGTEKGRKALKEGVKKVSDIIKNKLENKKVDDAGEQETAEPKNIQTAAEAPEPVESQIAETSFITPPAPTQEEALAEIRSRATPQLSNQDLPEGAGIVRGKFVEGQYVPVEEEEQTDALKDSLAPMREEMMARQQDNFNGQQNPSGQEQPEAQDQQNAQSATQNDSAGATDSAGAEGGIGEGSSGATSQAVGDAAENFGSKVDAGLTAALPETEGVLDALGPVGWLVGLFLGVGTLVGGIEGANGVKNPSVPKPPHIASVATQFGIGQ